MSLNLMHAARQLEGDLVSLRRDLHRHPELGFQEIRTAGIAAARMRGLGLDVRTEVGITGVVAEIRNGAGPTIVVRADMDALPIQEIADHDYASTRPGVMHACGHDAHTAALVGAAHLLVDARAAGALPSGTIRLLFQPAEEGCDAEGKSGAMRMIDDGAMDGVDAVMGLHVAGHAPVGLAFVSPGSVMAGSAELEVEVRGRSAHAAMPERGVDALVLAAQGLLACQQAVSRGISPMDSGVVTFGTIEGGRALNIIADSVRLGGTLRYFKPEVKAALERHLRASFEGLAHHGAEVDVRVGPGYIPVVNDLTVTEIVASALRSEIGEHAVMPMEPLMAAEDFAFLAEEAPGCFFWLGAGLPDPREHHNPTFDIDDSVLPTASASLATSAVALLREMR